LLLQARPGSERKLKTPCAQPRDIAAGPYCYIVRDAIGHALVHVYFEDEPGGRSAAHLMTRDEARRIAANIATIKLGVRDRQH
jgi:hypothetical protein